MTDNRRIVIAFDDYPHEAPDLGGRASVRSFNHRHRNSAHPDDFGLVVKGGRITSYSPGIRRRLETGTAFILSAYEHGNIVWSLGGEGTQCRWDTAPVAGILFIERKRGQTRKQREIEARDFLRYFNAWCNGEMRSVTLWNGCDFVGCERLCFDWKEVQEAVRHLKEAYNLPDDIPVDE